MPTTDRYILSGCSGGGKTTLLAELARRGFETVPEPGREIVREESRLGGDALPWINPRAFAERAIEMSVAAFDNAGALASPVFFDRSFIDAISFVEHLERNLPGELAELVQNRRYAEMVFLVPPWPEIFVTDNERQGSYDDAVAEYERLLISFGKFGYTPVVVPKGGVRERAYFVLHSIDNSSR